MWQSLTQKLHMAEKELDNIAEERNNYKKVIAHQTTSLEYLQTELNVMKHDYIITKKKADEFDVCIVHSVDS